MTTPRTRLVDPFGRAIEYLRLSITDRCDLRCRYCMPRGFKDYEEPEDWLTFDEIERVVRAFARLGVHRVRLTGGEPLLRRNLPTLAARLHAIAGIDDLSLSTNATQLARHARALRQAGVARLNVSLDSLQPERVREICGRDALPRVLAGLAAARRAGFAPIKINMVVMQGVNDAEVEALVEFCRRHEFVLRLIEPMPVGASGRALTGTILPSIRERLRERCDLIDELVPGVGADVSNDRYERVHAARDGVSVASSAHTARISPYGGGPARYLRSRDGGVRVGFITPMSQHFCAGCNRVRLSVDGTLYLCLGQNDRAELRPLLRAGASDAELEAALLGAIARKPERHEFREVPGRVVRIMAQTGG
jgi:cyclic pyranopterin phosphate synthase